MTLLCITTQMPDVRSCTYKSEHTIVCDGYQYRWDPIRLHRVPVFDYPEDPTTKQRTAIRRLCPGCRPRLANKGLLCWGCWHRLDEALEAWPVFANRLTGIDHAVRRDTAGIRNRQLGYIPIPGTPLALDEITSYLRTNPGNPEMWIATTTGAQHAIRFTHAMRTALRSHPHEEKSIPLRRVRCQECRTLTLIRNPPHGPRTPVTVTCSNPDCTKIITEGDTWRGVEKLQTIAEMELPPEAKKNRPKGIRGISTATRYENFDPTNPLHTALREPQPA